MHKTVIFLMLTFFLGCSKVNSLTLTAEKKVLLCEEKAEPKSLQLLEQKYRCMSNGRGVDVERDK